MKSVEQIDGAYGRRGTLLSFSHPFFHLFLVFQNFNIFCTAEIQQETVCCGCPKGFSQNIYIYIIKALFYNHFQIVYKLMEVSVGDGVASNVFVKIITLYYVKLNQLQNQIT